MMETWLFSHLIGLLRPPQIMLEIADDFIESVSAFACGLAKHRGSDTLEAKDLELHLARNWGIRVPGVLLCVCLRLRARARVVVCVCVCVSVCVCLCVCLCLSVSVPVCLSVFQAGIFWLPLA